VTFFVSNRQRRAACGPWPGGRFIRPAGRCGGLLRRVDKPQAQPPNG